MTQEEILLIIRNSPGIVPGEIARETKLHTGTVLNQLSALRKYKLIERIPFGKTEKIYFIGAKI